MKLLSWFHCDLNVVPSILSSSIVSIGMCPEADDDTLSPSSSCAVDYFHTFTAGLAAMCLANNEQ